MSRDSIKGPVLVTGGAGYIGGQTVLCLLDEDIEVVVLDNLSAGRKRPFHDKTIFYEGSVQDQKQVEDILLRHEIQSILHFAGSIRVDESIENPLKYYENNTDASRKLISAAINAGVARIIFSSTAAVYGAVANSAPVVESAETSPLNPYGWSKLFTERALHDVFAAHGLQFGILRYFNVAGADLKQRHGQFGDNPVHLIGRAMEAMLGRAGPLEVFGTNLPTPDGTGVRDYIHVTDLAEAHIAILGFLQMHRDNIKVNLGYGHGYSVLEVVQCLKKISGREVPYRYVEARAGEAPSVVANVSHLHHNVNWRPKYDDLSVILKSALDWILFKENLES